MRYWLVHRDFLFLFLNNKLARISHFINTRNYMIPHSFKFRFFVLSIFAFYTLLVSLSVCADFSLRSASMFETLEGFWSFSSREQVSLWHIMFPHHLHNLDLPLKISLVFHVITNNICLVFCSIQQWICC